jgi:hypothetical protein
VIADIRELQQAFDDAELHADTDRLNSLLADDFVSIGERGFQFDKRQWIARHAPFANPPDVVPGRPRRGSRSSQKDEW